jgi:hypothetical protein
MEPDKCQQNARMDTRPTVLMAAHKFVMSLSIALLLEPNLWQLSKAQERQSEKLPPLSEKVSKSGS